MAFQLVHLGVYELSSLGTASGQSVNNVYLYQFHDNAIPPPGAAQSSADVLDRWHTEIWLGILRPRLPSEYRLNELVLRRVTDVQQLGMPPNRYYKRVYSNVDVYNPAVATRNGSLIGNTLPTHTTLSIRHVMALGSRRPRGGKRYGPLLETAVGEGSNLNALVAAVRDDWQAAIGTGTQYETLQLVPFSFDYEMRHGGLSYRSIIEGPTTVENAFAELIDAKVQPNVGTMGSRKPRTDGTA